MNNPSRKPKYSVNGFHARIKMSKNVTLWAIVEGRNTDRPFYQKLLKNLSATRDLNHEIYLAENIDIGTEDNPALAGGRKRVELIAAQMQESGLEANPTNRLQTNHLVFLVDRDFSDLTSSQVQSNLIKTYGYDSEYDVLTHSQLPEVFCNALNISFSELGDATLFLESSPEEALFSIWNKWLKLSLTSQLLNRPDLAPPSRGSQINSNTFGPVDSVKLARTLNEIHNCDISSVIEEQSTIVDSYLKQYRSRIISGKLLLRYLIFKSQGMIQTKTFNKNVRHDAYISIAISLLVFRGAWVDYYEKEFMRVLH